MFYFRVLRCTFTKAYLTNNTLNHTLRWLVCFEARNITWQRMRDAFGNTCQSDVVCIPQACTVPRTYSFAMQGFRFVACFDFKPIVIVSSSCRYSLSHCSHAAKYMFNVTNQAVLSINKHTRHFSRRFSRRFWSAFPLYNIYYRQKFAWTLSSILFSSSVLLGS